MRRLILSFFAAILPMQTWAMTAGWPAVDAELKEHMTELSMDAAWSARGVVDADLLKREDARREMLTRWEQPRVQLLALAATSRLVSQQSAAVMAVELLLRSPQPRLAVYKDVYDFLHMRDVDWGRVMACALNQWVSAQRLSLVLGFLPEGTAETVVGSRGFADNTPSVRAVVLDRLLDERLRAGEEWEDLPDELTDRVRELKAFPGLPRFIALLYTGPADWSDDAVRSVIVDASLDRMHVALLLDRYGAELRQRFSLEGLDLPAEKVRIWTESANRAER